MAFITFRSYDENGKKVYTLFKVPKSKSHTDNCRPDPLNHILHEFSRRCYQKFEDDPIKSIGDIYSETRKELFQELTQMYIRCNNFDSNHKCLSYLFHRILFSIQQFNI